MERLIGDVLTALREAGLAAMRRAPGSRAKTPDEPVICVGVKQASTTAAGFYDYLGVIEDEASGPRPLFGRRVACTLLLEAVSPARGGAEAAEEAARQAQDALLSGELRARLGACVLGEARLDGAADVFRCPLTVEASLLRYFVQRDEDGMLTDFDLKGEWK